jgi:hypothetical protein
MFPPKLGFFCYIPAAGQGKPASSPTSLQHGGRVASGLLGFRGLPEKPAALAASVLIIGRTAAALDAVDAPGKPA